MHPNSPTARGLFNYAVSYLESAKQLIHSPAKNVTHPNASIEFLLVHSIELFCKSCLRTHYEMEHIRKLFGHDIMKLYKATIKEGLPSTDLYNDVIESIHSHKINTSSRYIEYGYKESYPSIDSMLFLAIYLQKYVDDKTRTTPTFP